MVVPAGVVTIVFVVEAGGADVVDDDPTVVDVLSVDIITG